LDTWDIFKYQMTKLILNPGELSAVSTFDYPSVNGQISFTNSQTHCPPFT